MTPPRIAAVIPLYNGAGFIAAALQSVLRQSLPPTEIIVIDDGSSDEGASIVRAAALEEPRIRLIQQPNAGQSAARNRAASLTDCDYIALLDQDDTWYEDHLEALYAPFADDEFKRLGFVYGDIDEIDGKGRLVQLRLHTSQPAKHPKRHIHDCISEDMFILPGASLIRIEAMHAVGGFDERLIGYEDDDLFRRIFEAGYSNAYVSRAVARWRIHSESTSYTDKMNKSRMIYARKLIKDYPDDLIFNRFYTRDLIAPRFAGNLFICWKHAILRKDHATASTLRRDSMEIASHLAPGRVRRRIRMLAAATTNWALFQALYRFIVQVPMARRLVRAIS